MTALIRQDNPWSVQPGWGIFVDLTPPELLSSRQVRIVRQIVLVGLVAVLLLCAGGWFLADSRRSAAEDALANAQLATSQLQHEVSSPKYANITQVQALTKQINAQVSSVMKSDIAMDQLVYQIAQRVGPGMRISQTSIVLSAPTAQTGTSVVNTIDTTSHARIGNVTLTGTARKLVDVSGFVVRLAGIDGVLDVVPTSNARSSGGIAFNITFTIDDARLSHRFDLKGGK